MKKAYLTFDIEPLVSSKSFNPTIYNSMLLGGLFLANELEKRNLKATFYVSLSRKTKHLDSSKYYDGLDILLRALKSYENISIQPHMHAFDIPMDFSTKEDLFAKYSLHEQTEMLKWAIKFLNKYDYKVTSFRPGSYSVNDQYYQALKNVGIYNSSVLNKDINKSNIDLINNKVQSSKIISVNDVLEFPVTSIYLKSIKGHKEVINLSPDFLTLESMKPYFAKLDFLNINYHSFSIFTSRFLRENHNKIWLKNFKYLFYQKPINFFMKKNNIELIEHNLTLQKELIKWLDHFEKEDYKTLFIGEV